jgi:hypothetical protein
MLIALHAGAHATDEDRLVRCLAHNADGFAAKNVAVPDPDLYRPALRALMDQAAPGPDPSSDPIVDPFAAPDGTLRLLLSDQNLLGPRRMAAKANAFYPGAADRLRTLVSRLPENAELRLFLAIRNPATFFPAVLDRLTPARRADALDNIDPAALRWSRLVDAIRAELPDLPITLWCNEDTPLIWGQILRRMAGLPDDAKVLGAFDLLSEIMRPEGMQRFRAYLKEHPDLNDAQRRRVMAAFLQKFAMPDRLEQEIDLPGWSEALIGDLTAAYDVDVERIRSRDGIDVLLP